MKPLVAIVVRTSAAREILDRNLPKIRENLFPTVKSEIQIRENFFPRNAQNCQSAKLNSRENFVPHGNIPGGGGRGLPNKNDRCDHRTF